MNQLKRVFNDDLEIDIENDDLMNHFFEEKKANLSITIMSIVMSTTNSFN